MKILLSAEVRLFLATPGHAGDQPFADYAQLLATHADEVTPATIVKRNGLMPDLGVGAGIDCLKRFAFDPDHRLKRKPL